MEQRWLSLSGICTTLGFTPSQIFELVRSGHLVALRSKKQARYLDPTPEYAERLKLGEAAYRRAWPLPSDLDMKNLLTAREIAEIVGWTMGYAEKYLLKHKLPAVRVGKYKLYSVAAVREILWRRSGRRLSKQKAPFLVSELIAWFLQQTAAAAADIPTDAQFSDDAVLERKLARMAKMPSPRREMMMAEFFRKMDLARTVAHDLKTSSLCVSPQAREQSSAAGPS